MRKIKNFLRYLLSPNWIIGIGTVSSELYIPFDNVKWLKTRYRDRWFADPFILDELPDQIVILAEEFCYNDNKGKIVTLWVNKTTNKIVKRVVLLTLDTHLSFPIYYRHSGNVYLYPENSESSKLSLYKLNKEYDKLIFVKTIIDRPLSDSVIFKHYDNFFIITTEKPLSNNNKIAIFRSNEPFGNYTFHQEILLNDNTARRAGAIVKRFGKLISISQECNRSYGEGLVFSEIVIDSNNKISFEEIFRFKLQTARIKGVHTYNEYNDYFVIDAKINRIPLFGRLLYNSKIIKFIKSLQVRNCKINCTKE